MASAAEQLAANLNFSSLGKATELRQRIWFTLGALIVFRIGTYIPMPGIDPAAFKSAFDGQSQGILGIFNMLAGGAVGRMAIFALGIMPYISASIIVQLLATVSPRLEALKKEGEAGRKAMNQYTRMGTVVLAAIQAFGIAAGLQNSGVVLDPGPFFLASTVITLTGGVMAGVPGAQTFFNVAFVVVLTSLLLQGSTIAWSARRLGLALPEPDDLQANRLVFGDFVIDGATPMDTLCAFYGLPVPPDAPTDVATWMREELRRPAVEGDSAMLGAAELSVRALEGGRITRVGIRLG